jgi:hypothetical protein
MRKKSKKKREDGFIPERGVGDMLGVLATVKGDR